MEEEKQVKININGTEYNLADLSDDAKAQVKSLRFADAEIKRLKRQLALVQTAHNAYMQVLQATLPKSN